MNWSAALPRGKVQLNPLTELACSGINSLGKERHTKVCTAFRSNFEVLIQSEKHRVVYEPGEKWITVFYFARSLGRPHASPTQIVSLTTLENEAAISTWVWPHLRMKLPFQCEFDHTWEWSCHFYVSLTTLENEAAISAWVWPHLKMKLPFQREFDHTWMKLLFQREFDHTWEWSCHF